MGTYAAFISYSHADRKVALWLHEALERFRIPSPLRRTGLPPRIPPVFLDSAELHAGADLNADIATALERSLALIVVCSPAAAASPRVEFEVREFRRQHPDHPIFAVLAAGRPNAAARGLDPTLECLPAALRSGSSDDPLAADLRRKDADRREALLKIIAGLLRVPLDTLRARDAQRARRRMAAMVSTLGAVAVVMAGLAAYGLYERQRAQQARLVAEREAASSEEVTRFLVGVFGEADPELAKNHEPTVRETLDTAVGQLLEKNDTPLPIRARLLRAIGIVYASRGWYAQADRLLRQSIADLDPKDPALLVEVARSQAAYASLLAKHHDPRAESLFRTALPVLDADPGMSLDQLDARATLAYVLWSSARYMQAKMLLTDSLELLRRERPDDISLRANLLQTLGRVTRDSGDRVRALPYFKESAELCRQLRGENYFWYGSVTYDIGSIDLLLGRYDAALTEINGAIAIFERTLGPQHAFLAGPLQARARLYFDRGQFPAARADLERALSIHEASGNAETVDAARAKAYLARMAFERRESKVALQTMDDVLAIEQKALGDESAEYSQVLRWKALLLAREGRWDEAAPLLGRARLIAEREEASNPPRLIATRQESALAYCIANQRDDARRALDQARVLEHTQVVPWSTWIEDAIGAACGSGDVAARRAAWEAARSKIEAQLGPHAPILLELAALPPPAA